MRGSGIGRSLPAGEIGPTGTRERAAVEAARFCVEGGSKGGVGELPCLNTLDALRQVVLSYCLTQATPPRYHDDMSRSGNYTSLIKAGC